ncbi:zinc-binding alcohol dehydrogenase [Leptospira perolatii]|uniref:Zinc-binding alcohol dehydrogenase n=1 Tax=Leptospira perolatii TaxID=2023191 RepID=A0A2M9ZRG5_9LEPT|nr:zinc-binding alcohol dehydrogenase [Leptospira perolatii]PJZ70991.1 zinc-binding alcohol dehydrogenase [Leptospira perolatii]PJZ74523.1 zinc-binding alcohol dehydrogenase [Leptospira perolatii]
MIQFQAYDYFADDSFQLSEYSLEGSESTGWKVYRNGQLYLELGAGYRLLRTELCGICSTDLDRRFLPFPLPQILGHEVLAKDPNTNKKYVLEINDTPTTRSGIPDKYSRFGIPTHSPDRMVLGIDRLPGGFGPYLLAPIGTLIEVESLTDKEAVLMEPFAASYHGVEVAIDIERKPLKRIAVLGPRRLGSLVIAALHLIRKQRNLNFRIAGIVKNRELTEHLFAMGADEVYSFPDLGKTESDKSMLGEFSSAKAPEISEKITWGELSEFAEIVFDTTGASSGLENCIQLSSSQIHRKTTNGKESLGIQNLTELVVDEFSIAKLSPDFQKKSWGVNQSSNQWLFLPKQVKLTEPSKNWIQSARENGLRVYEGSVPEAKDFLDSNEFTGPVRGFDFSIVDQISLLDQIIRPDQKDHPSLLRPRGIIFVTDLAPSDFGHPFLQWISKDRVLSSSRCGDFQKTMAALKSSPGFLKSISERLISAEFKMKDLPQAYLEARKPEQIKVIVRSEI